MKAYFLLFIFCLIAGQVASQEEPDDELYPTAIILAEEAFAVEDFNASLDHYRKLFFSRQSVLAKDAFNACQLAALHQSADFNFYFEHCAKAGIDIHRLQRNRLINGKISKDSDFYAHLYKKGHDEYLSRIDTTLRAELLSRYTLEQSVKGKSNYAEVVTNNFNRILALAKENRFPGEHLVGPDDNLGLGFVIATLLHYPYSFTQLQPYLLDAVKQGSVSPFAVYYVYSFNQTRTSVLYTAQVPVDKENFELCYNLPFGRASKDTEAVNANRKLTYLPSLETEAKLKKVAAKYGIEFMEGY